MGHTHQSGGFILHDIMMKLVLLGFAGSTQPTTVGASSAAISRCRRSGFIRDIRLGQGQEIGPQIRLCFLQTELVPDIVAMELYGTV